MAATTTRPIPATLQEQRCPCGALLAKVSLKPGSTVEIVCRRCRRPVLIRAT